MLTSASIPRQPSNVVASPIIPPINAHATSLCKLGSSFDETMSPLATSWFGRSGTPPYHDGFSLYRYRPWSSSPGTRVPTVRQPGPARIGWYSENCVISLGRGRRAPHHPREGRLAGGSPSRPDGPFVLRPKVEAHGHSGSTPSSRKMACTFSLRSGRSCSTAGVRFRLS